MVDVFVKIMLIRVSIATGKFTGDRTLEIWKYCPNIIMIQSAAIM